ncbi:hypothetical protein I3J09_02440 [Streptomyces clavuligerus]|uniref:Uncharacterized protein n=5 Tax=Streptomyces clavuligerus TaxID=1901 RepID=B5GVN5_STRCL|nr:hypothetical protein [Streptomyces clavuligerus]ANW17158.1 hypothetical protein BB341_02455 [Streptomyces clavuligerus]AXU11698.1 hypothetical protein D1794_02555 [Streptomyces clavuligerus]EDY50381.1 hypothetical protein SSCG_03528 [Streptomyces clavuligerus]EFG10386.1 Hypothetical protein SCLAV_5319 [Streptomyces clavuligerus]MBY6301538.1 hypothetical protein [Streptomyces clavuligerus]
MTVWRRVAGPVATAAEPGDDPRPARSADDPAAGEPRLAWFADDPAAGESWAYGCPSPEAAARAWAATADAAARVAGGACARVVGDGLLARLVRLALPPGASRSTVIETTGTNGGIGDALASVRPGGLVLLAARPLHPTTPLPTYHVIHLPGVRLLPLAWRDGTGEALPEPLLSYALRGLPAHRIPAAPKQ